MNQSSWWTNRLRQINSSQYKYDQCFFVFLTLIGISYSPFELLGQTDKNATVRGIIYDGEEAGEPLIGGNVILNNGDGAATDFNGAYSFNTKPGSYTITVKYIGYQTQTKNIQL